MKFSLRKFFVVRGGCWLVVVCHFLAGFHCFADIDQVDLLGGGGRAAWLACRENYFLYLFL